MPIYQTKYLHITSGGVYSNGLLVFAGNYTCALGYNITTSGGGTTYLGTADGSIGKGTSKDTNWSGIGNKTAGMSTPIIFIIEVGDGRIYYANETNHFYTDDEFDTVVNIGSYFNGQPKSAVYVDNNIVLTASSNGYVAISIDNCETWSEISGNPPLSVSSINSLITIE